MEGGSCVRLKERKMVCILLAMIVFLSGIFLENAQVDNLSSRAPMEATTSCIQSANAIIVDTQLCTTEMLDMRSVCGIQQLAGQRISPKGGLRNPLSFLCLGIFQFFIGRFLTGSGITDIHSLYLNEPVINYIHRSDGKKRI